MFSQLKHLVAMLLSILALRLLLRSAVCIHVATPKRDYQSPASPSECSGTILDQQIQHPESDLSPSHNEIDVNHIQTEVSSDLIERAHQEADLYSIIGGVAKALMATEPKLGSAEFIEFVHTKGTTVVSWEDDPPVQIMGINEAMARDPFLIANELVEQMRNWYYHHDRCGRQMHFRLVNFEELCDLLKEIRERPNSVHFPHFGLERFQQLYYALQNVFHVPAGDLEMRSHYALFYYYLYYVEYARWISQGTLKVISFLGEGSQSVVFKVGSTNNSEIADQQIFALKIYKNHNDWMICQREERILKQIMQHNCTVCCLRIITAKCVIKTLQVLLRWRRNPEFQQCIQNSTGYRLIAHSITRF